MKRFYFLATLCVLFTTTSGWAQGNYRFHAVYLYNFTKYISWPNLSGEFVIGVYGASPIEQELNALMTRRTVEGHPIVVKRLKDLGGERCHVLYVPANQSRHLNELKVAAQRSNTLLITEKRGLIAAGSHLNFILVDNRWKFELNEEAIRQAGLRVSSELVKLAVPSRQIATN